MSRFRGVPGEWSPEGHKGVSLRDPHLTLEGFRDLGLPAAKRHGSTRSAQSEGR
ncbi:hypothetical protein GCM10010390_42540 [Streptomyces mordarskii]|uniref:Uncharacterized protein n=1 Tax=Streptomyces mordarskii TaxID=1226758 RepID=A0ABP3N8X3_9ACTN